MNALLRRCVLGVLLQPTKVFSSGFLHFALKNQWPFITPDEEFLDSIELNPAPLGSSKPQPLPSKVIPAETVVPEAALQTDVETMPPQPSPAPLATNAHSEIHAIPKANTHDWHERLAHLSRTQIKRLHAAKLIHILKQLGEQGVCDICPQRVRPRSNHRMTQFRL